MKEKERHNLGSQALPLGGVGGGFIIPTLNDLLRMERFVVGISSRRPVKSLLLGKHKSHMRGRGLDFEEARQYVAGDDIRNIDWRVTARTGITHTKVFTEEKERPCFIITDLSQSMFFGSKVYTKSFLACQFAAMAAFEILHHQDRLGGLVYGNDSDTFFIPQRSRKALLQYFNELVVRTEQLAATPQLIGKETGLLSKALKRAAGVVKHDYVLLVISDFNQVSEESKLKLVDMARHNDVVLVKINDALELQLPHDKLVLSDGDMQLFWQSTKKDAKAKYDSQMNSSAQSFVQEMRTYGIPTIQLNTAESVEEQVKSYEL
ncbi:MAG: DUF58 domain-containing protein [Mangrovibacterium sp.]